MQEGIILKDYQRLKVYGAEDLIIELFELNEIKLTLDDIRAMIFNVVSSEFWVKNVPDDIHFIRVIWDKKCKDAYTHAELNLDNGKLEITMSFPPKLKHPIIVYHEIAHILAGANVGHGKKFCTGYLKLLKEFCGEETARQLQLAFDYMKVRY